MVKLFITRQLSENLCKTAKNIAPQIVWLDKVNLSLHLWRGNYRPAEQLTKCAVYCLRLIGLAGKVVILDEFMLTIHT